MIVRKLRLEDAPKMLEWMRDNDTTQFLARDFKSMTLADCEAFIQNSWTDKRGVHLAIVDEHDEYVGTVSLKRIDREKSCTEFAISTRACARGKGYATQAMKEIIRIAHEEENLQFVYWNVQKINERACRFYDKNGFEKIPFSRVCEIDGELMKEYTHAQVERLLWYLA